MPDTSARNGWWTATRIDCARRMRREGYTEKQIAAALGDGCSKHAVHAKMKMLEEPAQKHDRRKPLTWTHARVLRLVGFWCVGLSLQQIANNLGGCTREGVRRKLRRLGKTVSQRPVYMPPSFEKALPAPPKAVIRHKLTERERLFNAEFFGDPSPERSALAQRRQH